MYIARQIADYIVAKAIEIDRPVTNIQLQKTLYHIQKDFLETFNKKAFSDDIESWAFGPCIPSVYYRFCAFGCSPISFLTKRDNIPTFSAKEKKLIDKIVEEKSNFLPWEY